jgi:tRNA/rRNA methyltransferase
MQPDQQDRLIAVLVRARNPSNIGASARALHDLGFRNLRIVNDFPVPFQAAKAAVDASSVLESAQEFLTVAEAVADCTLVFGTTAVGERVLEHPLHKLPQAAPLICSHLTADPGAKVALLFGSEKTGLSNDELSHCHALVTIPMNPLAERHLSMNLGQAVAVCLYAIAQADDVVPHPREAPGPPTSGLGSLWWFRVGGSGTNSEATAGDLERLTSLLREILEASGYTRRNPANSREPNVRRLIRRMALTAGDAQVWTGILRQLRHALTGPAAETDSSPPASHTETPKQSAPTL